MVRDAWLPVGYLLPDGARTKTVLHEGIDWQIVGIDGGGRALLVRETLAGRWTASGLIETGRLSPFVFGEQTLLEISFPDGNLVVPVNDCR